MVISKKKSYVFGFYETISENDFQNLTELFKIPVVYEKGGLEGRGEILKTNLEACGAVIVKHYKRGGLVRHFLKQSYFKTGKTRAEREFTMLEKVRSLGVKAPEPVVWAYRGGLLYKCWLVTREIENSLSLAAYFSRDPETIEAVLRETARQVNLLIDHNILHVDLHPGNVLIDDRNDIFLIDFDKSHIVNQKGKRLRAFYCERWDRAVEKYGMNPSISTLFKENLIC